MADLLSIDETNRLERSISSSEVRPTADSRQSELRRLQDT